MSAPAMLFYRDFKKAFNRFRDVTHDPANAEGRLYVAVFGIIYLF